jgi:23S rRNA (uracil1939-C5)-methyltransferase
MVRDTSNAVELTIEKLVYGGDGLARLDGQVVLAPFVLPGERVQATTERVKTGLLRGSSVRVLEAAPERVVPRCEYFANCGGCHYQHADYAFQLEQKREILRETLRRLGGFTYEGEINILSGEPWNYRNRIQLHFDGREGGFHKAGSHNLCAIDHCHISSPLLNQAIQKLQSAAKEPEWPEFLRSLELFTDETQLQLNIVDSLRPVAARFFEWCGTFLPSLVHGPIEYRTGEQMYRISRGSFFQVNRFLIDTLVQEVVGEGGGRHAVDLYAGVGLFSLPLSWCFEKVDAVEHGGPAYRDLEWNVGRSSKAVRPAKTSAEEFLRNLTEAPELIVADPPRAGLGKEATAELLRVKAPKLTFVSCDPATLARDVKKLLTDYRIERLTLVDLFPQTYHFEAVVHLVLNSRQKEGEASLDE